MKHKDYLLSFVLWVLSIKPVKWLLSKYPLKCWQYQDDMSLAYKYLITFNGRVLLTETISYSEIVSGKVHRLPLLIRAFSARSGKGGVIYG